MVRALHHDIPAQMRQHDQYWPHTGNCDIFTEQGHRGFPLA
jgi:hypothetical protein